MGRIVETIRIESISAGRLVRKYTVEERADGKFISASWEPNHEFEVDRLVEEFETCSGALCDMYREVIAFMGAYHSDFTLSVKGPTGKEMSRV